MSSLTESHKKKIRESQLIKISKLPKRKCLYCGKIYKPKAFHQKFHNRKCHKEYKKSINEKKNKYPEYSCQFCGEKTQLDFNPTNGMYKLQKFKCPHCGKKRK